MEAKEYANLVRSHTNTIVDASVDASNTYLVTCSSDASVRVWSLASMTQLYDFTASERPAEKPTRVCFRPTIVGDRTVFACGFSAGAKIRLFNVTDVKLQSELNAPHLNTSSTTTVEITDLKYTSDGKRLLCGDSLKHLSLFNSEREYSLVRVLPNALALGRFALSPDDRFVAAISSNQQVISIYDTSSLNETLRVSINGSGGRASGGELAACVAYSTVELNQLVCVTSANKLLKFDARSGRLLSSVPKVHRDKTDLVSVTSDGQFLITSGDNFIKIWDYQMRLDTNYQVLRIVFSNRTWDFFFLESSKFNIEKFIF